jgi:hypothetical protein
LPKYNVNEIYLGLKTQFFLQNWVSQLEEFSFTLYKTTIITSSKQKLLGEKK